MAIDTAEDLFLYELGIMGAAENDSRRLLSLLEHRTRHSDLVKILQAQQQDSEQLLANIGSCLEALDALPLQTRSETVEGIIKRFEEFILLQPAPDMLDQFAIDTAIRFAHVCIAGYKTLVDWAILMDKSRCVQGLYSNLILKQESAGKLERFSHELGVRLLTSA